MMSPDELRQAYVDFFKNRGHAIIPSAPMVPENDPTTLFTGSGMQPMLPYLLGQPHPKGTRIVDSQKAFRSQDIEEVGDNRHDTFFEMLGNWSLGDYFKKEQLEWIFEFFVDVCHLDPNRLYASVYSGNESLGIPRDDEAVVLWQELFAKQGIEAEGVDNVEQVGMGNGRIFYYGDKKNWWSRVGEPKNMPVGEPGGPDSEVFYDFGEELKLHEDSQWKGEPCHPNCDCGRFLEIANNVFMAYVKTPDGFEELKNKNIDFGGGFERILTAMNNDPDMFKTEIFAPIIRYLEKLSNASYGVDAETDRSFRVIADHVRSAVMLAADGVFPSNKEQGYYARRLVRRSVRYAKMIGIEQDFVAGLVPVAAALYEKSYPEVAQQQKLIIEALSLEEKKFNRTLAKGLREFEKEVGDKLTAEIAFKLYESYGFPLELSAEEAQQRGIAIDQNIEKSFAELRQSHAQQSRTASAGMFKGGLQDHAATTVKYHTATHLLHAALRKVLGDHATQAGSNITGERLRFDFKHSNPMTESEIRQVEQLINDWIDQDLPVSRQMMAKDQALAEGATAFFGEKYPDKVSVYTIGLDPKTNWTSKELCGGPHVEHTGEIGAIELFKEQSTGAGTRRIYARLRT